MSDSCTKKQNDLLLIGDLIRIGSDDETGRFLGLYLFNFSPEWVRGTQTIKTES